MFDARLSFSIPKFTLFKNGMFGKDTDSEFDGEDSSDAAGEDLEQNDMVTVQVEESEKDENAEAELKEIKSEDAEEAATYVFRASDPSVPTERIHSPPISLLSTDKGKPGVGDIKANANIIRRTLQKFRHSC